MLTVLFALTSLTDSLGCTPLAIAAKKGFLPIVQALHQAGANIEETDNMDRSILFLSVMNNQFEVCKYLVENHADINQPDFAGTTPLMAAASHFEIVKYLVNVGADVNAQNEEGGYALYFACQQGNLHAVKLLMNSGAKIFEEYSLLHGAAESGNLELVQYCMNQLGSSVHDVDVYGQTPLHLAAFCCNKSSCQHYAICKLLLQSGAQVNALTLKTKIPPIWFARNNVHFGIFFYSMVF